MEVYQIIAKLVIHSNLESLKLQQIVVSAKKYIMMMELLNYVSLVITHGFLLICYYLS